MKKNINILLKSMQQQQTEFAHWLLVWNSDLVKSRRGSHFYPNSYFLLLKIPASFPWIALRNSSRSLSDLATAFLTRGACHWTRPVNPPLDINTSSWDTWGFFEHVTKYLCRKMLHGISGAGWVGILVNYVWQQECEDYNLSLIKQLGMTNKIIVV